MDYSGPNGPHRFTARDTPLIFVVAGMANFGFGWLVTMRTDDDILVWLSALATTLVLPGSAMWRSNRLAAQRSTIKVDSADSHI